MKKIVTSFLTILCSVSLFAQTENTTSEIIDYCEKDGKIIVKALINGIEGDFLLDLAGHNAIMEESLAKYKIDTTNIVFFNGYTTYQFKKAEVGHAYKATTASVGNNAYGTDVKFFALKNEPYLRELGVDGVVNSTLFRGVVLTIDTKRKKITTTVPFRPPYMKLDHRATIQSSKAQAIELTMNVNGVDCLVLLDTWNNGILTLNETDFARLSAGKTTTAISKISIGYGKEISAENEMIADISFVKSNTKGVSVTENKSLTRSVAGLGLFQNGIVSLDFSKDKIYFQPHGMVEIDESSMKPKPVVIEAGKLNPITRDYFIETIFDYKKGGEFVSKSDKLIVIDFWATWCGPCMKLMPQMEALAAKYKDRVIFMKVNADKERELCNVYNVLALPTLFFIPPGGKPMIEIGVTPEKVATILEKLLK